MEKTNRRLSSRVRNLIVICLLSAIILIVSTYAWFVGLRSVSVSNFDVEIAAAESLLLSLDGSSWKDKITFDKSTLFDQDYTNNTNSWSEDGLVPMSSVGDMDSEASRMILYEQASFTKSSGGYRIMASRVHNYKENAVIQSEKPGYVAFDLFIKNISGTQYLTALEPNDEEAIYLTTDSKVTVASDGVANTGIENSVRIAFAQIGRVIGTETTQDTITGITCTTSGSVTGICRQAQIWEPNDTAHVANAISYYDTSCKARSWDDDDDVFVYNGACGTVTNGVAKPTYAINREISSADAVDIYDGTGYNNYTGSTSNTTIQVVGEGGETVDQTVKPALLAFNYFTDTEKDLTGVSRPPFMTLAPNSITKVRVYIYIEGQDVDNYSFAAIGKKISIMFGFTKERFTPTDIDYDGPYLPTTLGLCTGELAAPDTEDACRVARGIWTSANDQEHPEAGTCAVADSSADGVEEYKTKEYCDIMGGTFTAIGTCTGGNVANYDTQEECEAAPDNGPGGTWDATNGVCTGNTETYCTFIQGTFTPAINTVK